MRQSAAPTRKLLSLPRAVIPAHSAAVLAACIPALLVIAAAVILDLVSTGPSTALQAGLRGGLACALVFACALLLGMVIARPFKALTTKAEAAERARQELESHIALRTAELQEANERLRQSEARYRTYFEHTVESLFVVEVTADGRFVYEGLNPAHEQAIGISSEELSGKAPHDLLAQDVADELTGNYRRCVQEGRPIRYEEVLQLPGGRRRWETSLAPVRDSSGRICLILGSARDITERERAQEEAERSRRLFQRIADAVPDILYVHDLSEGRNVYINQGMTEILGYSREQIAEMGDSALDELLHPEDRQRIICHPEAFNDLPDGQVIDHEYRMRHANGGYLWLRSRDVIFERADDGRPLRLLGVARDITERKEFLDALRASEERFRVMAETVPGILFVTRPDGWCDYLNERFYEVTGLPHRAGLGTGWAAVLHPDDAQENLKRWWIARQTGEPFEGEYRFRTVDGSYRWFMGRSRPMRDAEGRIVKWIGTATDIDDLKRTEATLRQTNEKIRSILASISDCYFMVDQTWRFTAMNEQTAAWLGASREQLLGRSYWDVFPKLERGSKLMEAFEQGVSVHYERLSTLHADKWIEIHAYPSGEGLSVFFRDITKRKQAQAALRETQELLASTLDALFAHIAILDARGRIVAVNAAWRRFGDANGLYLPHHGIGADYLSVCDAAESCSPEASEIGKAIRAMLRGECEDFRLDYPCPDPARSRWFQLRITRFGAGDGLRLVLAHEDITEVKQAEHMLRRLAGEVLRSQDEERRRIARDLHDSTAQNLIATTLCLASMQHLVETRGEEIRASVAEAQALVGQSLQEIRTVSYLLHPPALEEAGLLSALQWFVRGYEKRTGIDVDLSIPTEMDRLPPDTEFALFRVVQEGLTNVHRHSGSATGQIRLSRDGGSVALEIRDQGVGMATDADDELFHDVARLGVGIPGMRLRLRQLGGELNIRSSGRGTVVRAVVPLSSGLGNAIHDRPESTNRRDVR